MRFLLFLLICGWAAGVHADLFLVEKIHTDVTDKDATTAREAALIQAQEKAFYALLDDLTLAQDREKLGAPEVTEILNLVEDFSVAREKTSSVRYLADVDIRFNVQKVQSFLQEKSIPYLSVASEKQLILPIYRSPRKLFLWEEDSPWRKVWEGQTTKLVPMVLPAGDSEDSLVFSSQPLSSENETNLEPLLKRYGAKDALVAEAVYYPDSAQIKITVRPFKNEKKPFGSFSFMLPVEGNHLTMALKEAQKKVSETLVLKWKEKNVVHADAPDFLTAVVPFNGLGEWMQMQKRLKDIKLIKKYTVKAVRKDQAQVEIHFVGDLSAFLEKLKNEGLFLAPTQNNLWSLRDIKDVPQEEIDSLIIPQQRKSIQFPIVDMESWRSVNEEIEKPENTSDFQEGFMNRAIIWRETSE